jgi:hypothetical protein
MSKRDEHRARKQQSKGKHAIIGFEVSAMNWFWTWGGCGWRIVTGEPILPVIALRK